MARIWPLFFLRDSLGGTPMRSLFGVIVSREERQTQGVESPLGLVAYLTSGTPFSIGPEGTQVLHGRHTSTVPFPRAPSLSFGGPSSLYLVHVR